MLFSPISAVLSGDLVTFACGTSAQKLTAQANILLRFNRAVDSTTATDIIRSNQRRLPIFLIIFGLAQ